MSRQGLVDSDESSAGSGFFRDGMGTMPRPVPEPRRCCDTGRKISLTQSLRLKTTSPESIGLPGNCLHDPLQKETRV